MIEKSAFVFFCALFAFIGYGFGRLHLAELNCTDQGGVLVQSKCLKVEVLK